MTVNTNWTLIYDGKEYDCGRLPVSCLGTLRGSVAPPDFSVGENQYEAERLARRDAVFRTIFDAEPDMSVLVLRGVDTVARVFLNGVMLGSCDNMHRVFAFRIPEGVQKLHENLLEVKDKISRRLRGRGARRAPALRRVLDAPGISAHPQAALYVRLGLGSFPNLKIPH